MFLILPEESQQSHNSIGLESRYRSISPIRRTRWNLHNFLCFGGLQMGIFLHLLNMSSRLWFWWNPGGFLVVVSKKSYSPYVWWRLSNLMITVLQGGWATTNRWLTRAIGGWGWYRFQMFFLGGMCGPTAPRKCGPTPQMWPMGIGIIWPTLIP